MKSVKRQAAEIALLLPLIAGVGTLWWKVVSADLQSAPSASQQITCAEPLIGSRVKAAVAQRLRDPGSLRNWQIDILPLAGGYCEFRAQGTFTAANGFGGRTQGAFIADTVAEAVEVSGKTEYNVSIRDLEVQ